jgi:hypothetical protein
MAIGRVSEKVVQSHVVHLLRSVGGAVYVLGTRRPTGDFQGTRQSPGIPDVYCLLPSPRSGAGGPRALWVEVKAAGGRLRPEQAAFREQCTAADVPHVVGGLDDVIAWLIDRGYLAAQQVPSYRLPKGLSV